MQCLFCGKKDSLYKEFKEDGKCEIICFGCGWKTVPIEHHAGLDEIKDIQQVKKDWQ